MATNANLLIGDGFCVKGDGHPDTVLDNLLFPLLKQARKNAGLRGNSKPQDRFKVEVELNKLLQIEAGENAVIAENWVDTDFSDYHDYEYELNGFGNDIYWRESKSSCWATRRMYGEIKKERQLKIGDNLNGG